MNKKIIKKELEEIPFYKDQFEQKLHDKISDSWGYNFCSSLWFKHAGFFEIIFQIKYDVIDFYE